ncbi:hypothetical protein HDU67_009843 [Dinochytrium kinnereticum]|nr:hypothetical protein HDU67_009843 [Dinochytrium kinnereticum]
MPELRERLIIAGLFHAVLSIALLIVSVIARLMNPRASTIQPPWELPLIGFSDLFGVIIILSAISEAQTVIELGGALYSIFPLFFAVYLLFTVPVVPVATYKLFVAAIARRSLAKALLPDPRALTTQQTALEEGGGEKKQIRETQGRIEDGGPHSPSAGSPTSHPSHAGSGMECQKPMPELSPHFLLSLFFKCLALSFLSVAVWGIARIQCVDNALGPHGGLVQRWLTCVTVISSLMRALVYALVATIGQFDILTPGMLITVYVCLGLSLLAIATESLHRLHTCHGSDGDAFSFGAPFVQVVSLDKSDIEYLRGVMTARKGDYVGGGNDPKSLAASGTSPSYFSSLRKPQFRCLRDRVEYDIAKRADMSIVEGKYMTDVAKLMSLVSSLKIQTLVHLQDASHSPPVSPSTRCHGDKQGPRSPPATQSPITGPPPFPMEIPEDQLDLQPMFARGHSGSPLLPAIDLPTSHRPSATSPTSTAVAGSPTILQTPARDPDPLVFHRRIYVGRERELAQVVAAARGVHTAVKSGNGATGKGFIVRGESGIGKTAFIEACKHDLQELTPLIASHTIPNRTCHRSFSTLGVLVGTLFESLNIMKDLTPAMTTSPHSTFSVSRSPTVSTTPHTHAGSSILPALNPTSTSHLTGLPEAVRPLLPLLNLLFPNFPNAPVANPGGGSGGAAPQRSQNASNATEGNQKEISRRPSSHFATVTGFGGGGGVGASVHPHGYIPETDLSRMRIDQPGLFLALATVIVEVVKFFSVDIGIGITVLVVEDVEWCDEMSLQVLPKLLKAASTAKFPLLILTSLRDHTSPRIPRHLNILTSDPDVSLITLTGLKPTETRTLANLYSAYRNLPEDLLTGILDGSKGNPLFIQRWVEIIRYYDTQKSSTLQAAEEVDAVSPASSVGTRQNGTRTSVEEPVRKALALSVEASDRFFLQQPVEAQEFMSLVSALGSCMDVEAMFYVYRGNAVDGKVDGFVKILRSLIDKRILIVTSTPDGGTPESHRPKKPHHLHHQRQTTVSDVPKYDQIWIRWDHESTRETSYKKLSMHSRTSVHSSAAKFLLSKLSRKEDRVGDVSSLLEVAYHMDRCGAKEVAVLYLIVAVEHDSYGYNFLIREDILLHADSISFRQKPSGPVDPPRPPIASEASRDLLHGTLEHLLSVSNSTSDPIRQARVLWSYGSQCVGRALPTMSAGSTVKIEAEWKVQAAAMKARIRHARSRKGMDDNIGGRRAGAALRDLVPLIGLNLDASYHRALHHIIQAVGMLEAHGASNGDLLLGYAWLQHHLAVGRHFGLREKIIKKGRDLIAAMSPEIMSKRRRSVAFFEAMIGMGSAAAGGYSQADAFLGSATVLADILALSYPLTDLYTWHVMILFQMGRIREAARLARDARIKMQTSGGSSDQTSRDMADALHILICLNISHGSHSRGLTLEVRRLAEELIHRVLEDLEGPMAAHRDAPRLRHAATVSHQPHPPPAGFQSRKTHSGTVESSAMGSSTGWQSSTSPGSPSSYGANSVGSLRHSSSNAHAAIMPSSQGSAMNDHPHSTSGFENHVTPGTPIPASRAVLLAVLALIAIHLPNPLACGKILDHLLFPFPISSTEENPAFVINPCDCPSYGVSNQDFNRHPTSSCSGAPVLKLAHAASSSGASSANGSCPQHHHPLKASWLPGIPFAIACALEACVRGLVGLQSTDTRRNSFSPQPYIPSHWNPVVPSGEHHPAATSSMSLTVKAWRARTDLAMEAANVAVKQKWAEPLAAELNLFRTCVRAWEIAPHSSVTSAPSSPTTGRSAHDGGGRATAPSSPSPGGMGGGGGSGMTESEVRKGLIKARDCARLFQRTWIEAFVHAQADAILNGGGDSDEASRPPPMGFEDYKVFEKECGGKIALLPLILGKKGQAAV